MNFALLLKRFKTSIMETYQLSVEMLPYKMSFSDMSQTRILGTDSHKKKKGGGRRTF